MPNNYPAITGNNEVDESLEDLGRSALRLAKEFRGVSQVAKSLVLFDVLHQGEHCPSTVAKKGHNSLVRLMLVARDELVRFQELRDQINEDPIATIADKINVSKAIQKGLADLTKAALDVEDAAESAAEKSTTFLVHLAEFKQKDNHHREKLHMDRKNISDDELTKLMNALPVPFEPVDPMAMDAVS